MSYARMGEWQKFREPRFREFLKEYYRDKVELAESIAGNGKGSAKYAPLIFDRIASPSVYLESIYKKWLDKRERDKKDDACDAILSENSTGVE